MENQNVRKSENISEAVGPQRDLLKVEGTIYTYLYIATIPYYLYSLIDFNLLFNFLIHIESFY